MPKIQTEHLLQNTRFLRALARSLLAGAEGADDVVQEAYLAALKRPPRDGVPLRAWLVAVVRNLAYRAGRDEARRAQRERIASRREWVRPTVDVVETEAVRQEVVQALLSLEEPYRTVLLLRFYDDLRPREIAARLGVPGTTVRTRIQRGLQQLRGRLDAGRRGDRRGWCLALAPVAALESRAAIVATLLTGGLTVMNAKIAVGVVLLLALGLLLYARIDNRHPVRAPSEATRGSPHGDSTVEAPSAQSTAVLPAPVDLEAVDIDRDVHGVVVRKEDGLAVAGAEVTAVSYPWRRVMVLNMDGYYEGVPGLSTLTASDGTFKLRLRRGQLVGVRVQAEGRARVEVPDVQAGERLRIELSESTGLTVVVRDRQGHPVEGTSVRFLSSGGGLDLELTPGTTDAGGRFRIAALPPGTVSLIVRASHPTHGSGWNNIGIGSEIVEVTLDKGRTITGSVTDVRTGTPVAGARVGMNWTLTNAVEVDAEGRYVLPGWTGKWVAEIAADAPAYAFQQQRVGEADSLNFQLEPGGSVVARVVDAAGRPLAGVFASAVGSEFANGLQQISHRHTTSGPDGRLRLDGLWVDLLHKLVLTTPGQGRTLVEFRSPPPDDGPLDLGNVAMPPGRAIEGAVSLRNGTPSARTEIILKPRGRAPSDFYGNTEVRRTDHLGRFRFPDQSPGSYTLEVRPPGSASVTQDVKLEERDLLGVDIRLPGGREFVVFVQDASGRPVPNAYIAIWQQDERGSQRVQAQRQTDETGRAVFVVQGKVPEVNCTVRDRAFLPPRPLVDISETQGAVRFVLREAGQATGTVLGPGGEPLAGGFLEVRRGADGLSICTTDRAGEFEAQVPTDGPVDLVLIAVERTMKTGAFYDTNLAYEGTLRGVVAGADGLVLQLRARSPEGSLSVRVVDPEGKPVGGMTLSVHPVDGFASARTDEEGRALLTGLPVEELTLQVNGSPGGDLVPPAAVKVVPRGQDVLMRCRPGSVVTGVVLLPDGKPLAGSVMVTAQEGPITVDYTQSGEGGRFTLHVPKEPVDTVRLFCHVAAGEGKQLSGLLVLSPDQNEVSVQLK